MLGECVNIHIFDQEKRNCPELKPILTFPLYNERESSGFSGESSIDTPTDARNNDCRERRKYDCRRYEICF